MIPNTATSLWFSVSSTFTITSPCSIDAIRAESSPMRCWRNVASLAGGCCACSGTPTVAPQPARATQPSSLIPPLARTCTICPPLPRPPSRPTDATPRRPGHVLFAVHLDQLKEVRHRQRPNGETENVCSYGRTSERSLNAPMSSATPATIAKPAISPMIAASVTGGGSKEDTDATTAREPNAPGPPPLTP